MDSACPSGSKVSQKKKNSLRKAFARAVSKETYLHAKIDLITCQKRPIYNIMDSACPSGSTGSATHHVQSMTYSRPLKEREGREGEGGEGRGGERKVGWGGFY